MVVNNADATVLPLGAGQILLRGQAVVDLARLAEVGLAVTTRRDGIATPRRMLPLLRALEAEARAAMSGIGRAAERETWSYGRTDMPGSPFLAASAADEIDVKEASVVLGIGCRQVTRMAQTLGGRKIGRSWVFPRSEVLAVSLERGAA